MASLSQRLPLESSRKFLEILSFSPELSKLRLDDHDLSIYIHCAVESTDPSFMVDDENENSEEVCKSRD